MTHHPKRSKSHPGKVQPVAPPTSAADVHERSGKLVHARTRLFPHALLMGIATGLMAVAFRLALEYGDDLRAIVLTRAVGLAGLALLVAVAFAMIGVALWLVIRFCPEASGSGIPHLRLVLRDNAPLRWRRVLPVKFCSGLLAIVGGLCLGREGPTIQMGAALSAMWGDSALGRSADRRSLLVTGASAGLAAAFNAPLAGILFAIEELRINVPDSAFAAAMVACVSADIVVRLLLGQSPEFGVTLDVIPPLESLPAFAVLGAVLGLFGWLYNRSLIGLTRLLRFRSWQANVVKVAVTAVVVGVIGWTYPPLLGGNLELTRHILSGEGALGWLAVVLGLRFVMSIGSYAVGTAGGIFAPLLVLGGLVGLVVANLAHAVFPGAVPHAAAFAIVGMSAAFAGIVRCPLTGVMLIVEMTGHYALILPLMVSSFIATFVADATGAPPVYDGLLESQLADAKAAAKAKTSPEGT